MVIKAIETRYSGCRFRSRTEARWCVLFNAMEWAWEYEPQGFATTAGNYLPDFRLTVTGAPAPVWFEVKGGDKQGLDDPRWLALAAGTGLIVVVAAGMHRTGDNCATAHGATAYSPSGTTASLGLLWQRVVPADVWATASSARFEFGEAG